jgi:hypothetical protein
MVQTTTLLALVAWLSVVLVRSGSTVDAANG